MDANATPQDSTTYNWGRYREYYPRATARENSIRAQVESWDDPDDQPTNDDAHSDEETTPFFRRPKPAGYKEPDHSKARSESGRPQKRSVHNWELEKTKGRIVGRPYSHYTREAVMYMIAQGFYWSDSLAMIEDPVFMTVDIERCDHCNIVRGTGSHIKELNQNQRDQWLRAKGIDPFSGHLNVKVEVDVHQNSTRKRKKKKSGRKRK